MRDDAHVSDDRSYKPPEVTVLGSVESLTAGDDGDAISPIDDLAN